MYALSFYIWEPISTSQAAVFYFSNRRHTHTQSTFDHFCSNQMTEMACNLFKTLPKRDVNVRMAKYEAITEGTLRWEWSEERDKDKGCERESEICCESWDELLLWLQATVYCKPHWAALSLPARDHLLQIISLPTTASFVTSPSGFAMQPTKPTWRCIGTLSTAVWSV